MADGYGFGGEGDWKTSVMLHTIKAMGAGEPGGTSFMEDYTYHLGPGTPKILGAHMLEVCPTIAGRTAARRDPPAGHRRPGGPGPAGVRRRARPATMLGICDMGDRFRLVLNEVDVVRRTSRCPSCRSPGRSGSRSPSCRTSAESWLTAGGPHHTVLSTAVGTEEITDFADMIGVELLVIDGATERRDFANRSAGTRHTTACPGVLRSLG